MTAPPIRVLIVNDSRTVRASLRRPLSAAEGFQVVAELDSASSIVAVIRRADFSDGEVARSFAALCVGLREGRPSRVRTGPALVGVEPA